MIEEKEILRKNQMRAYSKSYYQRNREQISKKIKIYRKTNKESIRIRMKKYSSREDVKLRKQLLYRKNREAILENKKLYWQKNKAELNRKHKIWLKKHPNYKKSYMKMWLNNNMEHFKKQKKKYSESPEGQKIRNLNARLRTKNDIMFHLNQCMHNSTYNALKANKAGRCWEDLVGYTLKDLVKHLEERFRQGMTWDNYGRIKGIKCWEIDHVKPRSLFVFNFCEDGEFKKCWALENLQPLWHDDNLKKSNKYKGILH